MCVQFNVFENCILVLVRKYIGAMWIKCDVEIKFDHFNLTVGDFFLPLEK